MTLLFLTVGALALLLGYANGANDVSRGIATLVGSGVGNFRAAVAWGTAWTFLGSLAAAAASQSLVAAFSGKGFLARPIEAPEFLASVGFGAAAWVLFTVWRGLPVSTTHSLVGALAGAGVISQGWAELHWAYLAKKAALPLALSPFLALAAIYALFPLLRFALARVDRYCLCLERRVAIAGYGSAAALEGLGEAPVIARSEECAASPAVAGRVNVLDGLHWISSAATSFARSLNDTPKVVAIGIAAAAFFGTSSGLLYAGAALAMAAGSLVSGFRVTETLARRVTAMSPTEGFSANLVTTVLVGLASWQGLPVSTTQISTGAIVGVGLHRDARSVRWTTVGNIAFAWLVTVPAAGLIAVGAYAALEALL